MPTRKTDSRVFLIFERNVAAFGVRDTGRNSLVCRLINIAVRGTKLQKNRGKINVF
jgi:hypothetical protein